MAAQKANPPAARARAPAASAPARPAAPSARPSPAPAGASAASAPTLDALVRALRAGQPILLLDSPAREGEADMVVHASFCDWAMMRRLRAEAGGWICLATDAATAQALGLEYMADLLRRSGNPALARLAISKTPYGDPSPFSIHINHRSTYTGIPDGDRALTIQSFGRLVAGAGAAGSAPSANASALADEFARQFYAPGHVPLILAKPLAQRKGHTDLAIALTRAAGLPPATVVCEMLGDDGKALGWAQAQSFARAQGLLAVDGTTLLNLLKERAPEVI